MEQNLWERGRRKEGDETAHVETVNKGTSCTVQGRGLPSQDSNAVGLSFFLWWISQKIGITVSFLSQTKYGHYGIELIKNISL